MGLNQFRRDPITGRWTIIVWNKHTITDLIENRPSRILSDKEMSETRCTFCEGHENETPSEIFSIRHNDTQKNEPGWTVRVIPEFDPILQIYGDLNNRGIGMYDVLDGIGAHEIVIESPGHGVQIYQMEENQIQDILSAYRERILDLKKDERFRYILLHKNYGEGDGERIHHSYSQIIATPITPTRVKSELMNALEHYQYKERCIFCDVIHQESLDGERVILQNDRFMAFAPFASRAPFEVWILPKNHETFFEWTTELSSLAPILKQVLGKIHRVLRDPHYVMVLHSGPNMNAGKLRGYWKTLEKDYHWHIEITPRFRGYTSFEIGSGFQINTVPPEEAAKILREEKLT
ncbi:MAG: galactose-1-phosphate uridylyltransferase [Calditrichaeota bacterium]|nr:MAG: galactose-1-phosphate uridylyltransferase [Calditrichota bacterium]